MASLFRPTIASYVINEKVTIDTTDREDHTFCGITFPIQCKTILPVDHIVISNISVRGALGPVTVWVTKPNVDVDGDVPMSNSAQGGREERPNNRSVRYNLRNRGDDEGSSIKRGQMVMKEQYWDKIYEKKHRPTKNRQYCNLDLETNPIILKQGEIRGIYIHSTHESDQGIVYDNQQKLKTHDDQFLTVLPGRAHVSPEVFGTQPIWGWGNAWRDNREFVGRISYGVAYKLWNPSENLSFGGNFRNLAKVLFMCQRRWESSLSMLSDDCIFYILNMCRWDWMGDDFDGLRLHRKSINLLEAARTNNANDENNGDGENEEMVAIEENAEEENDALGIESETQNEGVSDEIEMEEEEEASYDSDYAGSDGENSDTDDGYDDHRGSSTFQYFYYDDCGSSDEEREVEAQRERRERTRLLWLRNHFGHHLGVNVLGGNDGEDSNEGYIHHDDSD